MLDLNQHLSVPPARAGALKSQSALRLWAPLVMGLAIAVLILEAARAFVSGRLDEAALGSETVMLYKAASGRQVLCVYADDHPACMGGYDKAARPPAILWLGNSQLPAINCPQAGDVAAPILLHDALRQRGKYLVTYAFPNANLLEHGLAFAALARLYKPKLIVLPVFLDDIREQGIRSDIARFLEFADSRASLTASPVWPLIEPYVRGAAPQETANGNGETLQKWFEGKVDDGAAAVWPLWQERALLRGTLGGVIHKLRNRALGITAQTKRKVDPAVYREKMAILGAILDDARQNGIQVLLYVPPFRMDIAHPYVPEDYDRLKQDLARLAGEKGAALANLENEVPGPEWGMVVDQMLGFEEYDFMHFTGEGHRRHAAGLDRELRRLGF